MRSPGLLLRLHGNAPANGRSRGRCAHVLEDELKSCDLILAAQMKTSVHIYDGNRQIAGRDHSRFLSQENTVNRTIFTT